MNAHIVSYKVILTVIVVVIVILIVLGEAALQIALLSICLKAALNVNRALISHKHGKLEIEK